MSGRNLLNKIKMKKTTPKKPLKKGVKKAVPTTNITFIPEEPSEKAIQFEVKVGLTTALYVLTNKGRLVQFSNKQWSEVRLPNFAQFDAIREQQQNI